MTKEEKEAVLHCLRAMIDEELCEECPLYGTTGTDHCEKDCVRLAIEELEQEPCDKCVYSTSEGCQYDDITETIPPFEDCISRQAVIEHICESKDCYKDECKGRLYKRCYSLQWVYDLPPVNPQKPEDAISRQAVLDTLERMDKALDEDRTVENYKELLRECYKVLPSVSSSEKPNINEGLDKIRAEIDEQYDRVHPYDISCAEGLEMALNIIDKYIAKEGKA